MNCSYVCVHTNVHNCRTQYSIEQFSYVSSYLSNSHHCSDNVYWREGAKRTQVYWPTKLRNGETSDVIWMNRTWQWWRLTCHAVAVGGWRDIDRVHLISKSCHFKQLVDLACTQLRVVLKEDDAVLDRKVRRRGAEVPRVLQVVVVEYKQSIPAYTTADSWTPDSAPITTSLVAV